MPPTFIAQPASSGVGPKPAAPIFVSEPVARTAAYPTVGQPQPVFVHPEQLRPHSATGPLMSREAIDATVRRQSQLRMGATIGWALFTTVATFTKDTALAAPAGLLWLVLTVALPIYVVRTNRSIDARMKTSSALGSDGQVISAHRAGRMRAGQQLLCAVVALFTYGVVVQGVVFLLQTDPSEANRGAFVSLAPFATGVGAAIIAYRLMKAQLVASASR